MSYLDFVANTSWVDITPMFNTCPVKNVMEEISIIEKLFLEERDKEQYKLMKEKGATGIGENFRDQKNWSAVTLYSASGNYDDILTQGILHNHTKQTYRQSLRNLKTHRWTQLSNKMPNTVEWIKKEIGKYMMFSYIKIAKLDPGGHVPIHKDIPNDNFDYENQQNTYNMLNSFLIELNNPDGVKAWHDNVELPYKEGSIIFCNQSKSHGTINNGDNTRYNIRIQGMHNKKFRQDIMDYAQNLQMYPATSIKYL